MIQSLINKIYTNDIVTVGTSPHLLHYSTSKMTPNTYIIGAKKQTKFIRKYKREFVKSLKKRDSLIKDDEKGYSENIKTLDLQISMCIKKRGKVTKGGFNYILEEMWDWRPHYPMDSRLLPKIMRNLN